MRTVIRRAPLATLLFTLTLHFPLGAQDLLQGRATVAGQTATFVPAVGLWDAKQNTVSMLFTARPLSSAEESNARRAGSWAIDAMGPVVKVSLSFAPGKFSGALNELDRCEVGISGFKAQPIEISGKAADCHLISTGGRLQAGGMLIGLLEGKGNGYAYRLPFSVMFPMTSTTTMAAPTAPSPAAAPSPTPAARAPAAPSVATVAPNTVTGMGTFKGQTLRFTHGLAWVSRDRLEIALFEQAPRAGILAELKTGSWGDGGPAATLTFMSEADKSGPAAITYCYVNLTFPNGGMSLNVNNAKGCGLTDIGGDLKPGGNVTARLAGSAPMRDQAPMTWDLRFNLPISK